MPIYEYACRNCGHHFERMQQFSDKPATECPECHHEVHRVLSAPAIIFNGPGFYVTDNGKNGGDVAAKDMPKPPIGATCKMCA